MNAIRIRKHLDSETMHLPELRQWVGTDVEIIVLSDVAPPVPAGNPSAFFAAAGTIDIDDAAVDDLRAASKL